MRTTTMHTNTNTNTNTSMSGPTPSTGGSLVADHPVTAASGRTHPARPAAATGPAPAAHSQATAHRSFAAGSNPGRIATRPRRRSLRRHPALPSLPD